MDESEITNDEIIEEETKIFTTNFNENNAIYILLASLLITVAFLIVVSIYCYLIKYKAKQNTYYHFTSQMIN